MIVEHLRVDKRIAVTKEVPIILPAKLVDLKFFVDDRPTGKLSFSNHVKVSPDLAGIRLKKGVSERANFRRVIIDVERVESLLIGRTLTHVLSKKNVTGHALRLRRQTARGQLIFRYMLTDENREGNSGLHRKPGSRKGCVAFRNNSERILKQALRPATIPARIS